jgi:hypothetical protein
MARLMEGERAVAHDAIAVAGGVAGIAHVNLLGHEPTAPRGVQQPVDRPAAAGFLGNEPRIQIEDRRRGLAIARARRFVRQVMRKVRAHDDERLLAAPQHVEDLRHLRGRRVADHDGHEIEIAEHRLQERHVHLERMLHGMRAVAHLRERQRAQLLDRRAIEAHRAEGRVEGHRRRQRDAVNVDAVRGTREHDSPHASAQRLQPRIHGGRDGARVDVPSVRRNDRLRRTRRRGGIAGIGEIGRHLGCEAGRFTGIEAAGHGSGTSCRHVTSEGRR